MEELHMYDYGMYRALYNDYVPKVIYPAMPSSTSSAFVAPLFFTGLTSGRFSCLNSNGGVRVKEHGGAALTVLCVSTNSCGLYVGA